MKAPLFLASSVAVGSMLVVPAPAQAAIAGPVHARVPVATPANWIDNAIAPTGVTTTNSISTLMVELVTQELRQQADSPVSQSELAATTAIDVLRLMADLSNL